MGSLGLDTSIIVRFLTGKPDALAEVAYNRINEALQSGHELVVSDLAIAEAYYVLHKIYDIPKQAAMLALLDLFKQPGFRPEANGVAIKALNDTAKSLSKKPGMVDRMLHAGYMQECEYMLTFKKAARNLAHVEVLK